MGSPAITPELQQSAPEGQNSASELPQMGEDNRDMPEDLQSALKALVTKLQGQDKYARRSEVIDARRQRFYDRGDQYIFWNAASWVFVPATGGGSLQQGSEAVDMPRYTDVYNIFHGYLRSIVAVLTQNPPGVNFEPDDPNESSDITAAQAADKFKHVVDRANERKALQADIARFFCTDGRVVLYTRTVKNAQKFGTDPDTKQPKSGEIITAYGVLEHKCPILAASQDQMHFQIISDEMDTCMAKTEYSWAAEKIKEGDSAMGESSYERMARLGVLQGTRLLMQAGDAYAHIVTRQNVWLRPSAFEDIPKGDTQDQIKQLFPSGCHLVLVGDAYCASWDESMDDHLALGHPQPGDGQSRASWMKPMVPIQDAYNDYKNMRKEYHDYGIPITAWHSEYMDLAALREQVSEPGNNISGNVPAGLSVEDCCHTTPPLTPPADLIQAEQDLMGQLAQFVTAVFPALFGGNTGSNDTLGGIAIQRDQAMGNMGLPWGAIQELYAKSYKQAVTCAAKRAADDETINIAVPGKRGMTKTETLALADLKKGNFHCFPDTDSTFPETFSARKAALQQFFLAAETNPALAEAAVLPDNLELAKEYSGLTDITIPSAQASNKQLREIEQLLKTTPIPPSPQELQAAAEQNAELATAAQLMGGQEPPPVDPMSMLKPSIEIDPENDYNKYEYEECRTWLNSEERYAQEQAGNQAGILNVKLHAAQHKAAMAADEAPPQGSLGALGGTPQPAAPAQPPAPPPTLQ